jgi:hypothetical protein
MAAARTFLSRFFLKSQSWQAPRVWQQVGVFFCATNSSHDLILWLSLLLFCVFRNFVYEHSFLSEAFCRDLEFHGCK